MTPDGISRLLLVGALAGICGGAVGGFLVHEFSVPRRVEAPTETVAVLVAMQHLQPGERLDEPELLFKKVRYLKGDEPPNAVKEFSEIEGKTLTQSLGLGQPLRKSQLESRRVEKTPPPTPHEEYLIALSDMNPGDKITNIEQQFKIQEFLPGTAPPKSFSVEEIKTKPDKMLGKVLLRPLAKGEPITERHLKDDNLTDKLPEGYRAMTYPVRLDAAAVASKLPGTRVDMFCHYTKDGNLFSRILLQNVLVLAVNTEMDTEGLKSPAVATLAITPQEAEKVVWALRQSGVIMLAPRKPGDDAIHKPEDVKGVDPPEKEKK